MSALTTCLLGWAAFAPALAPVPPEPTPDPLAKAAIGIAADRNSLLVTTVYPQMPAGKAGIRTGDRIVRIGTLHPTDFDQVVNHITSYRPGAVVEMEVERHGERVVVKMRLVPRPATFDDPNRGRYPLPGLPDDGP
jgi:S1-C subfamily serine protease